MKPSNPVPEVFTSSEKGGSSKLTWVTLSEPQTGEEFFGRRHSVTEMAGDVTWP